MTGNAARKAELLEQRLHALGVLADVGIDLGVGVLHVRLRHQRRAAVAGTGNVDHIQVIFLDDPV